MSCCDRAEEKVLEIPYEKFDVVQTSGNTKGIILLFVRKLSLQLL